MSKSIFQLLKKVYDDEFDYAGYDELSKQDKKLISKTGSSATYGEITPKGTEKLLDYLEIDSGDIVYDLGSGAGKFVIQAALTCPAHKIVGLELSNERHKLATKALAATKKLSTLKAANVAFRNSDIMTARLKDATIVYTCSTAFPPFFMKKLTQRLASLEEDTLFVSLQELEENKWFDHIDTLKLDMSWQKKTPVYVYLRNAAKK